MLALLPVLLTLAASPQVTMQGAAPPGVRVEDTGVAGVRLLLNK